MYLLAIETSCDETAAAVLENGEIPRSNVVATQYEIHGRYGGVVPELASRRHLEMIIPIINGALKEAGITLDEVNAIAVTRGPGLVGSLLVGISAAKALAYVKQLPLVAVNHLEGHIHAIFLERKDIKFPFITLVASGGHTHLYKVLDFHRYQALGRTRDDAAGEAFDKVAKILNLGYPGGPVIDKLSQEGNEAAITFPKSIFSDGSLDFSFSGLKTAVLNYVLAHKNGYKVADIAAGFQRAAVGMLVDTTLKSAAKENCLQIVLAGGVACNSALRKTMKQAAQEKGMEVFYPSPALCTDNALMIAKAGYHRFLQGERADMELNAKADLRLGE